VLDYRRVRRIHTNPLDSNRSALRADARVRVLVAAIVLAGCSPTAPLDDADLSTSNDDLTCDLGEPGALARACYSGSVARAVTAAPLSSTNPPFMSVGGVHLVAGATGNEGVVQFRSTNIGLYNVYLGTPNIPFRIVAPDGSVVAATCTSLVSASECRYLRRSSTYQFENSTAYRLEFGPTTERYVRVVVLESVPEQVCAADELTEQANACEATGDDDVPWPGNTLDKIALDTVYGVQLSSNGGGFRFTPATTGAYELYLGTPNLPLDISAIGEQVGLACTTTLDAESCPAFRRGDRMTLIAGHDYTFMFAGTLTARYQRFTLRLASPTTIHLAPAVMSPAGHTPDNLTAADLDGDGALDLVVSNPNDADGDNNVDILHNNGDGTFTELAEYPTGPPAQTVVADFDHDGVPDIVGVAWDGQGPLPAFYLHGAGNSTFTKSTWGGGRDFLTFISAGDLDEDGTPEVVAPYVDSVDPEGPAGFVIVAVPSFTVMQDVPAFGHDTGQTIVVDIDGDGHQDVVVADHATSRFRVYRGDGSGTVTLADEVALPGGGIWQLASFDLDGDGRLDIVAIHGFSPITVSLNKPTGFVTTTIQPIHAFPRGLAAGDFDHDGKLDLATSGTDFDTPVDIFLQTDVGFTYAGSLPIPTGHSSGDTISADINGDGYADVVSAGLDGVASFLSTP